MTDDITARLVRRAIEVKAGAPSANVVAPALLVAPAAEGLLVEMLDRAWPEDAGREHDRTIFWVAVGDRRIRVTVQEERL